MTRHDCGNIHVYRFIESIIDEKTRSFIESNDGFRKDHWDEITQRLGRALVQKYVPILWICRPFPARVQQQSDVSQNWTVRRDVRKKYSEIGKLFLFPIEIKKLKRF